jgi:lactate racemase
MTAQHRAFRQLVSHANGRGLLKAGDNQDHIRALHRVLDVTQTSVVGKTIKGMVTPMDILEPGGSLIIASACSEGFGSKEFRAAQRRLIELGPDKLLATLTAKSMADVDEWQTEMQLKPMRVGRISLYTSGLSEEERDLTGVEMTTDLDETIARAIARSEDPGVAVIPEGPYVVPFYHAA